MDKPWSSILCADISQAKLWLLNSGYLIWEDHSDAEVGVVKW